MASQAFYQLLQPRDRERLCACVVREDRRSDWLICSIRLDIVGELAPGDWSKWDPPIFAALALHNLDVGVFALHQVYVAQAQVAEFSRPDAGPPQHMHNRLCARP